MTYGQSTALAYVQVSLAALLAGYLFGAIGAWDLNPGHWTIFLRGFSLLAAAFVWEPFWRAFWTVRA